MNERPGRDGGPASPEGRPEPFRPVTFYDLRLFVSKENESEGRWYAHFEEPRPGGWRTEQQVSSTVTGAIAKALALCLEDMAARDVQPLDSRKDWAGP